MRPVLELRNAANEVRQYAHCATDPVNKARLDQVANEIDVAANQTERLRRRWLELEHLEPSQNARMSASRRRFWRIAAAISAASGAMGLYILTALQN
jgi:hypothetical protein